MAKKLTLKRYYADIEQLSLRYTVVDLFAQEYSLPHNVPELIERLEEQNKIQLFCEIIFNLQKSTNNYCLDIYDFYLEFEKPNLKKDKTHHFSKTDAMKMFEICKEYKLSTLKEIGLLLLYRDYEPDSIFSFFNTHHPNEDNPKVRAALAQEEAIREQELKKIERDRECEIKPLSNSVITKKLTYSQFSRYSLDFNIKILNEYQKSLFWRFICILQNKRKDLKIFEKTDFELFIKKCFDNRNAPIRKEFYENHIKRLSNKFNKEQLDELLANSDYYKNYYGIEEYDYKVQHYTEAVNKPEIVNENLEKNLINDIYDFWPTEQECTELLQLYNKPNVAHKENALLNSIASLLHVVTEPMQILAYYLIPEKRIKLAEYTELDAESKDPFTIQPKLARPITKNILNHLTHFANRYNSKEKKSKYDEFNKIVRRWGEQDTNNSTKLYYFIYLVLSWQIRGLEIIEASEFSRTFEKQIQQFQAGETYTPPENDDFFGAMAHYNEDKDILLREIAILIEEGYNNRDIDEYYKSIGNLFK